MSTRDRVLALFVVLLWGLNFIAIRVGLDHFPPFFLAAMRFAVMALPVMLFVRFPKVRLKWFLLYVAGFGSVQFILLFLAMDLGMPTGLASLVLQTSAPFTVVLGVLFLRERMTAGQILGLVIAVLGMALIAVDRMRGSDLGVAALLPIGLTVLAGLSWAAGNIGGRLARPDDSLRMTLWMAVVATPPLYAVSLIVEGPSAGFEALATLGTESGLRALGGLAYLAIFGTVIGAGLWTTLLGRNDASRVSPMSLLVPVVGISAAFFVLGEVPTVGEIVGAVIVVAGCAAGVMAGPRTRIRPADADTTSTPVDPESSVTGARQSAGTPVRSGS